MGDGAEVRWEPGGAAVVVGGDVDLGVRDRVTAVLTEAVDATAPGATLHVDLGDVTFMDSSGLQCLVRAHREAVARDVALVLGPVSDPVALMVRTTGLDGLFRFDPPLSN